MAESRNDQDIYIAHFENTCVGSRETKMTSETKFSSSSTDETSLSSCPDLEPVSRRQSTPLPKAEEYVLNIYRELISFVRQEDFDLNFKKELNTAFICEESVKSVTSEEDVTALQENEENEAKRWEYLDEFIMRMDDLKRMECGIVITGDVSSGKTSLINKLVGEMLVTPKHLAATSKIVQIINSKELTFRAFDTEGNILKDEQCQNFTEMREKMDEYTNIRGKTKKYKNVNHIQACCPFKKLQVQGNVMLVDTPGIGDSVELTRLLLQYLPNAVAFIFLIDVSHAGGVQPDGLLKILKTILQQKSSMPCFEPDDVLFVTNKWNYINEPLLPEAPENEEERSEPDAKGDEKDDDEDLNDQRSNKSEKENVWDDIERKLKQVWPVLDMARVFKLNLRYVSETGDTEEEKKEFERFCTALSEMLKRNKNKRVRKHLSLLEETINLIEKGIAGRIYTATCDDENQTQKLQCTVYKMEHLKKHCKEIVCSLQREIDIRVSRLTERIINRLHSAEGKDTFLNPPGRKPIEKCILLGTEIPNRVQDGIMKWMMSEEVSREIDEIQRKISDYFQQVNLELDEAYITILGEQVAKKEKIEASTVLKYVATAPIWLPFCILLGALSLVVLVALSPLILIGIATKSKNVKQFEIDEYYKSCLALISKKEIQQSLGSMFRSHFEERIKTIFTDKLPKEIGGAICMAAHFMITREEIRRNLERFLRLQKGIQNLRGDIKTCFKKYEET